MAQLHEGLFRTITALAKGFIVLESVAGITTSVNQSETSRIRRLLRSDSGLSETQIVQAVALFDAFNAHNMIHWNH